ncbi:MAG: pyridoxine 5-phosphate synthase [Kiritimatiellia bacterium]|jgi:pyridoxine 5-phosphate synthase
MSASLSININKYALLRNSRGHDAPNLLDASDTCINAGCHGITVHPRRDERHIHFADVSVVAQHLSTVHPTIEYNVECEAHPALIDLVIDVAPHQCTLVPVTAGEITSDHGWDLPSEADLLRPMVARLRDAGIRVSIFMDCVPQAMQRAADIGVHRVELYTGPYAWAWGKADRGEQTRLLWDSAAAASRAGLGVNAGHDLDRFNLAGVRDMPGLDEVSIGHAQICRALDVGTQQSVRELLSALGYARG